MLTTLPPSCAVVMKSGNLNFLESSGPVQACNGTALLLQTIFRELFYEKNIYLVNVLQKNKCLHLCMFFYRQCCQIKCEFHPITGHEGLQVEQRYSSTLSLTLALYGCVVSVISLPLYCLEKDPVPLYRRLGGLQEHSGRMRNFSPPTGIRSPDHPAHNDSLYRLNYPGPRE